MLNLQTHQTQLSSLMYDAPYLENCRIDLNGILFISRMTNLKTIHLNTPRKANKIYKASIKKMSRRLPKIDLFDW